VGTAGTTINGSNYAFAGTTPSSTVSIGAGGAERTLTNVAAGRVGQNSTDAINGSQLYAANSAINAVGGQVTNLGTSVANSLGGSSTYNSTTGAVTTSLNYGGNTYGSVQNVIDQVSNSLTTVNGELTHYYSTNDGGTQQANYNNNGATAANSMAAGVGASATAVKASAVGYNTKAIITDSVALGSGSVSDRSLAPASGTIGGTIIPYNTTDHSLLGAVSVGSSTTYRQITNVADGTQPSDAVTVRQLTGALSSFATTTTKYFHANSTQPDSLAVGTNAIAVGPNAVTDGNEGVAMGDGATVQQNAPGGVAIGEHATTNLQDSVALGTNATASGIQAVSIGAGSNTANPTDVALGAGASASAQAGDVALGANSVTATVVATPNTSLNGVTYSFAGTNPQSTVSVGGVGTERTITNVAAGRISGSSTDAINGSQLYATNQAVIALGTTTNNLGNSVASLLGGNSTYDPTTGAMVTSLSYGGNTYNSVQTVLNQIGSAVNGSGIKYFHANSTLADSQPVGTNSVAIGPVSTAGATDAVSIGNGATASANAGDVALGAGSTTSAVQDTSSVTVGGKTYAVAGANPSSTVSVGSAGNERTITNVAAGQVTATSTDAINGSELYATNQQVNANTTAIANLSTTVTNINNGGSKYFSSDPGGNPASATGSNAVAAGPSSTASGDGSVAVGNGASSSGDNSVALGAGSTDGGRSNVVSVGSVTEQRQITNVAAGTASTDAVNVAQLQSVQAGSVQYDKNADGTVNYSSVTVGQAGAPAQIHNVATGTASTDAANVGQLNQGVQAAENWAQNYTDQKFAAINHDLNAISTRANAGIAAGIAMSSLGQAYQPNLSTFGVGVGTYHGEAGMAVGLSTITESGRYIFKLAASSNTRGDVGVGGSVNVVW
jgi:autotransporter adhesin